MELLRTPRLLLRHWEESDLPAFFDLYSRDDVMRWLGSHPRRSLATLDEARERLARWRARERDLGPPLGPWAVVPLVPGPPVHHRQAGTVLLMPLSDADGATGLIEVGWQLQPGQGQDNQGQGFRPLKRDDRLGTHSRRPGSHGQVSSCRRSRQNSLPSGSASTCHPSSPR